MCMIKSGSRKVIPRQPERFPYGEEKVSPDPKRLSSIDKRLPREKLFVKRLRNGLSGRTTELISTPRSLITRRDECVPRPPR